MSKMKNKFYKQPVSTSPTCQVNDHDLSWRITMSPVKRSVIILLMFVVLTSFAYAETNSVPTGITGVTREHDTVPEGVEEADDVAEQLSDATKVDLPEDTSMRLSASKLTINGNTLVTTEEILETLPDIYIRGKAPEREVYDFRPFHKMLKDLTADYTVSQKSIQGLTRYILSAYNKQGYAGIYVYVPAEMEGPAVDGITHLKDGRLTIEVIEGKVDSITITHYDFDREPIEPILKEESFLAWAPVQPGDLIKSKELDDYVRLMNVNPDRYIAPVITRGADDEALSINYDIYEANPWHWYAQIDNEGTSSEREWIPRFGLVNTNLTGGDDKLSLMYQVRPDSSEEMKENYSVYGAYEMPLWSPRLRVGVFGGYSHSDLPPGSGTGIAFRGAGTFYGTNLRFNVTQVEDWLVDYVSRFSYERSRTGSNFGVLFRQDVSMYIFGAGVEVHRSDDRSRTAFSAVRDTTVGGGSDQDEFDNIRGGVSSDFSIWTLSASHIQFLDEYKIHEISGSFTNVLPSARLTTSKLTSFGGLYSVRGYEQDEVLTDGGIIATAQYRFDVSEYCDVLSDLPEEVIEKQKKQAWPPRISLLTFVDYGRAKTRRVSDEASVEELLSMGVGTAWELGETLYANIYYAWPMKSGPETKAGDAGKWYFNIIARW
jgi:hemolysin activation/secretion protein